MPNKTKSQDKVKAEEVNWTINGVDREMRNRFVGQCKTNGVRVVDAVKAMLNRPQLLKVLFEDWLKGKVS